VEEEKKTKIKITNLEEDKKGLLEIIKQERGMRKNFYEENENF
jgi:hypothetical protein